MSRSVRSKWSDMKILVCLLFAGLSVLACEEIQPGETRSRNTQQVLTIGVVNTAQSLDLGLSGFKAGMAELGYVEGNNITYIYNGSVGSSVDEIGSVVEGFLGSDVDLILSLGTPATLAVKQATAGADFPVVFFANDPVAAGIVGDLRHPGENMTGTRNEPADSRRLELLLQVAPHVKRVYIPYNPDDMAPVNALVAVSEAASKLGVELVLREARDDSEVAVAVKSVPNDVDAVFLLPDTLMGSHIVDWVDVTLRLGLPLSGASRGLVEAGALIAYGVDLYAGGVQSARLADQILRGADPGDLPVESNPLLFAINLKTASAIGLDIPDGTLRQADIIIR